MSRKTVVEVVIVLGIMALAVGFRFYDIQHYPPGLFPDQAANGEDALSILHGDIRPFYERGNGREALFFYLQALMIYLFGVGVWPMFAASAIVGTVTVIATYFAARIWFGRVAAIAAALFLATNHWHVTISRTGFRAVMIPLFMAAFTAFVGYTMQAVTAKQHRRAWVYAVFAGMAFAGGFYTYIAYRAMIGVVLGMAVVLIIWAAAKHKGTALLSAYGHLVAAAVIAACITFLPLGMYFVRHPGSFIGRSSQVSIFNHDLQEPGGIVPTTITVTQKTLLSFFVGHGDLNWRHNVAGYPLLNPLVAALFVVGFGVTVVRALWWGEPLSWYGLFLLGALLLPVITTAESIPHALRALGLLFPIFWLVGLGATMVYHRIKTISSTALQSLFYGIAAGLMVLGIFYDGSLYFLMARRSADAAFAYRADLTTVSQFITTYVRANPAKPKPYLVLDAYSEQTVHFLTHGDRSLDYRLVDPAVSQLTGLQPGEIIIFTQSTLPEADRFNTAATAAGLPLQTVSSPRNWFNQEVMRVYQTITAPSPYENSLDA